MSRGLRLGIFALSIFLGGSAPAEPLTDPRCPEAMLLLVVQYQRATVRPRSNNPVYVWAIESTQETEAFYRFVADEFEETVLQLLRLPPESRSDALQTAALDFHLSPESMQAVLDYYAVIIFEEPKLSSSPDSFWPRVEALNRALRLVENEPGSAESRYLFYLLQMTHHSVPQLAKKLGFTESKVRAELSHLKVSILNEFERGGVLARARARFDAGEAVEKIARDLGLGTESLRFVLHYERELNRGSRWSDADVRLLRQWHARDATYSAIAAELNRISGLTPADPLYRTEGAVAAKVDALDLSVRRVTVFPATIDLPTYGQVKRNGHLTPAAQNYIRDHYLDSLVSVAAALGVQPDSLVRFIRRHDLVFRDLPPSATTPSAPFPKNASAVATAAAPAANLPNAPLGLHGAAPADRKAQARDLLDEQEKTRRLSAGTEPAKPYVLLLFKPGQSLHQLTAVELSELLKEAASHLGGVETLTAGVFMHAAFTGKEGLGSFTFRTLLAAWAIKQWQAENPDEAPLNTNQIFKLELSGRTGGDWLIRWKESQGHVTTLASETVTLNGLSGDTPLSSLTEAELSALLAEAAGQMGGVKDLKTSRATSARRLAARGSTVEFTFNTLLRNWAIKQWQIENQGKPALNTNQILSAEWSGKTEAVWLTQWKATQGEVKDLAGNSIVLTKLDKVTQLTELSVEDLNDLLLEATTQMGGVKGLNTGPDTMYRRLVVAGSVVSFNFDTLFTAWCRAKWQTENPDKPALNAKHIFLATSGGKTPRLWLEQWKAEQGEVNKLPAKTIVLKGLTKETKVATLALDTASALLKQAADQMGGVDAINLGVKYADQPLAAEGATVSFTFKSLLRAWAMRQWQNENPNKTPLTSNQVYKTDLGGKLQADWLSQWKASLR